MKWGLLFLCGLVLGAVGAFGGMIYLQQRHRTADDGQIMLAQKHFYDTGDDANYPMIVVSGTLTAANDVPPGDRLAYPNNTHIISCEKALQSCTDTSIEQIGPNQMGSMASPVAFQVRKWDAYQVIAGDDGLNNMMCGKVTITIDRKLHSLLWVEEPINQATQFCQHASTVVTKFTLEDSPGWRKLREATRSK